MINDEINNKLSQIAEIFCNDGYNNEKSRNFLGDNSGVTLFLFYYHRYHGDNKAYYTASRLLEQITEIYNSFYIHPPSLSKFEWLIRHVEKCKFIDIEHYSEEENSLLNDYLYKSMMSCFEEGNQDFLHGATGIGMYFINRNNENEVKSIVEQIEKLSEKDAAGLKWIALTDYEKRKYTYNISLSHGTSSIVVILSKIYESGIEQVKTKYLIENAVNYILAQKLPQGKYNSIFPNYALESMETMFPSRLAWCYGDLGIAVALYHASQALNRKDWEDEARQIMIHASKRRDLNKNGVVDACFCHGTSGIAHIFNRMYRHLDLRECKDAADYWIEQTLKIARFEDGLAGYKTWHGTEDGFVNEAGILEGIAGIGLVLLSYYYDIEPDWDECLLLS